MVPSKNAAMTVILHNELVALLNVRRLPARLNLGQTAAVLGFSPHDLPVLTSKNLLRPLGKPKANTTKYYAARDIEALASDVDWLNKATRALSDHWLEKNKSRSDPKKGYRPKSAELSAVSSM